MFYEIDLFRQRFDRSNSFKVEHCMKYTLLSGLKGSNYKSMEKVYNFRIKSGTDKLSIDHPKLRSCTNLNKTCKKCMYL
jgi:hypothetical protein